MTPEAERFLTKAFKLCDEAQRTLSVELYDAAGRAAYLAAFHAAQALVFERSGKVNKTHGGVHSEFFRVTKDDPSLDPDLRAFLSRAYDLKSVADYETGPESGVSSERATHAVATAKLFVARLTALLDGAET